MYLPSVGECALRTIFLDMHAKEAHVNTINLLKGKKCFGSVGKRLGHFSSVHKPDVTKKCIINIGILVLRLQLSGIGGSGNRTCQVNVTNKPILPKCNLS